MMMKKPRMMTTLAVRIHSSIRVNGPSENQRHECSQEHAVAQDFDKYTLCDR